MTETIAALRRSHDRLMSVTADLDTEALGRQSYCRDWTVAHVLSHIGSGAEIGTATLRAVAVGGEPPGRDVYREIWDRWDARSPQEQWSDAREADRVLVELLVELATTSPELVVPSYRGPVDLDGYALLRLAEHAVHTWDIEVVFDPGARLDANTASRLLVAITPVAGRLSSASVAEELPKGTVDIEGCSEPWHLAIEESVELRPGSPEDPTSVLSADDDAVVRLVYGRLDEATTPPGTSVRGQLTLDDLRRLFPGF